MSQEIKKLYRKKGLAPPDGKGVHTAKFHRCVTECASKQGGVIKGKVNCWAVCMSSIGKGEAVKKSHQTKGKKIGVEFMKRKKGGK